MSVLSLPLSLIVIIVSLPAVMANDWGQHRYEVDFDILLDRGEFDLAFGEGLTLGQFEYLLFNRPDAYMPDATHFNLSHMTINNVSGYSDEISTHATDVSQVLYGYSTSMSPLFDAVDVYRLDDFIYDRGLKLTSSEPPASVPYQLQNHAWAMSGEIPESVLLEANRRIDYLIERDDALLIVGLGNQEGDPEKPIIHLPGQAYNVLTCGISDGLHTLGPTVLDGAGRTKPDLVVPADQPVVSSAVPVLTSAAAVLMSTAKRIGPEMQEALHSEVLKAILMAGCTKHEFADWSRTPGSPLDPVFGVGELNIHHSIQILSGGRYLPSVSSLAGETGWNFGDLDASEFDFYIFQVPDLPGGVANFSAVINWNRIVTNGRETLGEFGDLGSRLPNVNAALIRLHSDGIEVVDQSYSALDNVEHLYEPSLPTGYYALAVYKETPEPVDYGLAWQCLTAPAESLDVIRLSDGQTEVVSARSEKGFIYVLEQSEPMTGGFWEPLGEKEGTGYSLSWITDFPQGADYRFRVSVKNY